jgi:threonine/homoserine/homoserine lactone efflux protein
MEFSVWLGFVGASLAMLVIPGPTLLMVIGASLAGGRGAALPLVLGVAAGDLLAMSLSLMGLGAVLAASATLFSALTWIGAAYLLWLAARLWRAPVAEGAAAPLPGRRLLRDAFVVTALNPKSIAFFVAFVPLFLDPARPFLPQAAVLVPTFVLLGALNAFAYAAFAARAAAAVRRPEVRRGMNRAGAALLAGAALATATLRHGQ